MDRSISSFVPARIKRVAVRARQSQQAAAAASVRRVVCPDGRALQIIVDVRRPRARPVVRVGHPSIGDVTPIESHGTTHRFHIPLQDVLEDATWAQLEIGVRLDLKDLRIPRPASSAVGDGPASSDGRDWAAVEVSGGRARLVRRTPTPGPIASDATSTVRGVSFSVAADVLEVILRPAEGGHEVAVPIVDGVAEPTLDVLHRRGEEATMVWRVLARTEGGELPVRAPDEDVSSLQKAYNFPMLIARDPADDLLYFAKPYFDNRTKEFRVRTGIREETQPA